MRPTRDQYFMDLAKMASTRSKDPNTQVGSCIVKDNHVLSLGYNGAPRNFPDDEVPTSRDTSLPLKLQKYPFMVHAELNAILNYRGDLTNLEGATIYVTHSPCYECAKALIQVGIKEVYYLERYHNEEFCDLTDLLFSKCGVEIKQLKEE